MTHRHTLLVVSVAVAVLVSPTILAQETATATTNTTNESGATAGMGAQLTAFTQSSAAAANDSVENGMWKAGFEQSNDSDRARLVRDRAGTLEGRLERLQRENASLRERYENGSLPEPAYIAQQSRLSARIDALRTAINDTDEAAARAGVDDDQLDRLRRGASNLTGPEVAAIARGLGGGPPEERGPPDDRGERGPSAGPGNGGQSANRTDGGPPGGAANGERGPPANRTGDSATGVDGGQDTGANATAGGQDTGDGRDATGSANGTPGAPSAGGSNGGGGSDDTVAGGSDSGGSGQSDSGGRSRN